MRRLSAFVRHASPHTLHSKCSLQHHNSTPASSHGHRRYLWRPQLHQTRRRPAGPRAPLASERCLRRSTDCSKDLQRSASLASLATSGSLNSLNDDDVGPTKAIDENDLDQTNYYELLGLEKSGIGVDADLVKGAYHKALLLYHPDKGSAKYDTDAVF